MLFAMALSLALQAPYATTIPTDTDLKAAFCAGYFQQLQPVDPAQFPESIRAQVERTQREVYSARRRIAEYMMPRIEFLQMEGILNAGQEGRNFFNQVGTDMQHCLANPKADECIREARRVNECRLADFLPF